MHVEGMAGALKALKLFDVAAGVALREGLKKSGELVRAEAAARFEGTSPKSALGYRVYLRGAGARVDVEQTLRRTTGQHPEFGAMQMRQALVPALRDKQEDVYRTVEAALTVASEAF